MKIMKNTRNLNRAFKVIARYDPDTYARMAADNWTVVSDRQADLMGLLQGWLGATAPQLGQTAISLAFSAAVASDMGCDPDMLTASVLVHEYTHVHQSPDDSDDPADELPAYDAAIAFASRLPGACGHNIAKLSEDSRRPYEERMAN